MNAIRRIECFERARSAPRTVCAGGALPALATALALAALLVSDSARAATTCTYCTSINDTTSSGGDISGARHIQFRAFRPPVVFKGVDSLLHCALPTGATWNIETIDPAVGAGGASIELDDAHEPLIAYHLPNGRLFWTRRLTSGWLRMPIDPASHVVGATSLARAPAGLAIAYLDAAAGVLRYAEQDAGGTWHVENVAPVNGPDAHPSLVVDGPVRAISFYDPGNHDLRYAVRVAGTPWTTQTVDNTADAGGYSSLVGQPSQGMVGVAYYDFTHGDLRYARGGSGPVWTIETVDAMGDVGRSCSAAALGGTALDQVGIAYYDRDHGDLKYALLQAGSWSITVLDSAGDAGRKASCGGTPVAGDTLGVVYTEREHGAVKYVYRTNNVTSVPTAAAEPHLDVRWRPSGSGGTIRFNAPKAGNGRVTIYDAQGRRVAEPLRHYVAAGVVEVPWDGRDADGRLVRTGWCFAQVVVSGMAGDVKLSLLR